MPNVSPEEVREENICMSRLKRHMKRFQKLRARPSIYEMRLVEALISIS